MPKNKFASIYKTNRGILYGMSIQVQQTPNPNALKFVLPRVYFAEPINISSAEAATEYPVAARLFALGAVYNVLMARDFITVNKLPQVPWDALQTRIIQIIGEHFCE